jgi:S1-C subfamily serine protease
VDEASPAAKAGIAVGDIVRKVNDQEVTNYNAYIDIVAQAKPGDELRLSIERGAEELSVTVKAEARRRRR